jgi:CspA family cold shock protein
MQGVIKKVMDKGFGFIASDSLQKDVFFHRNSLVGVEFNDLREGDAVTLETVDSPKGMYAINVQIV